MRAMLLVNPKATTTNARTRDVLIRALGAAVDLAVEETRYRGHAASLASTARAKGYDLVAVLGGDGTINETVNGLLNPVDGEPARDDPSAGRPGLIVIPGGSANVFARALGLPNDPVESTGAVLEALREGRRRTVGLGQALWEGQNRYFTFCSGMGYDAEVVRAVEGLRGAGRKATPTRYVNTALRHYLATDKRRPAMTLTGPGIPTAEGVFMAIISNTSPWTYVGARPVTPTPWASFETGLDLLGLRRMGPLALAPVIRHILTESDILPSGRHLVQLHDEPEFTLTASRPVAFELDGDYLGERETVTFRSTPNALQVLV
ncbi:diacylglycerol kinase family lipid kinase [Nonomuraea sp. KC401]|uniref:diacylglycerol/lipid kinase family protein n=1 Tax=unclassified Nonomuraea TaxID=2593643 RepID=UPI0010FEA481|nr:MULTISPECIES: diacylglycerol kinase family protein [unclassified Nonomuraea]NBE97156.1 diacylglycerol kinase family lipid kinase [Nonomuraea sp. K271]TLF83257.1 diacylglycerol kinase family lipid kinase [Nonomuraea sp. KC401]